MEITQTNQSRTKIITNDGYAYVKNKDLAGGWESFECERRRNYDSCKGKIMINGNQVIVSMPHHHAPNPARNEVLKIKAAIKRRAETTLDETQAIIGGALRGVSNAVAAQLPSVKSLRRCTQRTRNVANNVAMAMPDTRSALPNPLPPQYTVTNGGDPFLRWDSGDDDRILIFSSQDKLLALQNNNNWFMDGTFDSVPLIYSQIVTIHALVDEISIPCVYALLPNKMQATYIEYYVNFAKSKALISSLKQF